MDGDQFKPFRIFNTWMGDPSKLLLLETVVNVMKRDNLIDLVNKSGDHLLKGLVDMQVIFKFIFTIGNNILQLVEILIIIFK